MRQPFPIASMFAKPLPWHVMLRIRLLWLFGFRVSQGFRLPEWDSPWWFNLGIGACHFHFPPGWGVPGLCIFPWNAFVRVYEDHTSWGFGLLQINRRHMLGIVSNEEEFKIDFLWTHVASEKRSTP
jgi:hypothetical protein